MEAEPQNGLGNPFPHSTPLGERKSQRRVRLSWGSPGASRSTLPPEFPDALPAGRSPGRFLWRFSVCLPPDGVPSPGLQPRAWPRPAQETPGGRRGHSCKAGSCPSLPTLRARSVPAC